MLPLKKRKGLSDCERFAEGVVKGSLSVTAGEKCKVIGWQDGMFQDFGHHLRDEMGGIWVHPIKIADAFWIGIDESFPVADEYETLPYGTMFRYRLDQGVTLDRTQVCYDSIRGVSVRCRFSNPAEHPIKFSLSFVTRFDLLPVWFSDKNGITDQEDNACFRQEQQCVVAKDSGNPWFGVLGCSEPLSKDCVLITRDHIGASKTVGRGVSAMLTHEITLPSQGEMQITYYLTGSDRSDEEAIKDLETIRNSEPQLLREKCARYREIKNKASLTTSDPGFDQMFEWVKYNTDWLIMDCGQYGRALAAGFPEYAWWFGCDNAYSVQGLLAMGDFDTARDTLVLLRDYSEKYNGNGRIMHEITTNGLNAHPGNTQEAAHYVTAVYHYWRWTGDNETVRDLYAYCAKSIRWLLEDMDEDGDLFPSGYGIIEIKGLNVELIDTAVYTCQALFCMDELSAVFGPDNFTYRKLAETLRDRINTVLWDGQEQLYVDAVGTPPQIKTRIQSLLEENCQGFKLSDEYRQYLLALYRKMDAKSPEEDVPFLINKNWVVSIPMETMTADPKQAAAALETMRGEEFVGDYGIYLSGWLRRSTMTISTGVQAVAEGRYGHTGQSLYLLKKMQRTFGRTMPGSLNEMSPDYGCFVQAWTAYAVMVPVVECFAGIKPAAQDNRVMVEPVIPAEWDRMVLNHIRVGDAVLDFSYSRKSGRHCYTISVEGDIRVDFRHPKAVVSIVNGEQCIGPVHFGMGTTIIEVLEETES